MTNEEIINRIVPIVQRIGIKGVTLKMLTKELFLSNQMFYRHFLSREDLIEQVVKKLLFEIKSNIENVILEESHPLMKIAKIYDAFLSFTMHFSPLFYRDLRKFHPTLNISFEQFKQEWVSTYTLKLFAEAKQEGYLYENVNVTLVCELHLFRIQEFLDNTSNNNKTSYMDLFSTLIINNLRGTLKNQYQYIFDDYFSNISQ